MKKTDTAREIMEFINFLHPKSRTFEVCVMKPRLKKSKLWGSEAVQGKGIVAGYFDDNVKAANLAAQLNKVEAEGIYATLNPCREALKKRTGGKMKANISRTSDSDINRIKNVLIDIDPKRPSGSCSTKAERRAAERTASNVKKHLKAEGFPYPLVVDSGNGIHLIYRVDLENNEGNNKRVRQFLSTLADRFDTREVKIDRSVCNPSRLVRLPGTYNRKGEDLPSRPHRRARILEMPKKLRRVPIERIEAFVSSHEPPAKDEKTFTEPKGALMNVEAYLKSYGIKTRKIKRYKGGKLYVLKTCLFNKAHTPGKAAIIQSSEGKLYYQCFHNSCQNRRWSEARRAISGDDNLHQFYGNGLGIDPNENPLPSAIMTAADIVDRQIEEKPLIKGLLNEGDSLLIVGQTGIMKSMLSLNIAVNLACPPENGRLWGLFDLPCKPVKTIFIQSENNIRDTKKRIKLMMKGNEQLTKKNLTGC